MKKKKSFIVIGLGRFGLAVVKTLSELNVDVLALDIKEENVAKASVYTEACVIGDATNINVLKEIGAKDFDHAVVAIGNNLQASILSTINLKELGIKRITVRIDDELYKSVMEHLGATEIVVPEETSAITIANQIIGDNILDFYQVTKEYCLMQIQITKGSDKTLLELNVRKKIDINIIGIIRHDNFFIPKAQEKLLTGDIAIVVGTSPNISKFEKMFN